jgi:hypothetical protein
LISGEASARLTCRKRPITVLPSDFRHLLSSTAQPSMASTNGRIQVEACVGVASQVLRRLRATSLVGSPRGLLPEAPTDPDMQNSRIRLFETQLRYMTVEGRMRGGGSHRQARSKSGSIPMSVPVT